MLSRACSDVLLEGCNQNRRSQTLPFCVTSFMTLYLIPVKNAATAIILVDSDTKLPLRLFVASWVKRTRKSLHTGVSVHERAYGQFQLILTRIKELIGRDSQYCRNVFKPARSAATRQLLCQADCAIRPAKRRSRSKPPWGANSSLPLSRGTNHPQHEFLLSPRQQGLEAPVMRFQ